MKFTFHPDALVELNQAIDYYEEQQENIGFQFLREVYFTIQRIINFPEAYPKLSKNTRKSLTNKFPFAVIYQIKKDEILIIAVTHLARKPRYWKERINR